MNARAAAVLTLNRFGKGSNYKLEIEKFARQYSVPDKDLSLFYSIVKGVIQNLCYIDFIISLTYKKNIKKLERIVLNLLRVGVYQKMILGVPPHAAVYETVNTAKEICNTEISKLVNGVLRNLPNESIIEKKLREFNEIKALSIKYSHPEWLVKKWVGQFGYNETVELLKFNSIIYSPFFRHNPMKIKWEDLVFEIKKMGISIRDTEYNGFHFFRSNEPSALLRSRLFQKRCFSVQDLSQALSVFLLQPDDNDIILDCCAGPGGKTTLIGQITKRAKLISCDISARKIYLLKKEVDLIGIKNVKLLKLDASKDDYPEFNKVIIDAPCTATGTIAKNVDVKFNRKPEDIDKLRMLQMDILKNISRQMKRGNILVYSTCSFEREENWDVIDKFLSTNVDFRVEHAWKFIDKKYCDDRGAVFVLPYKHKMTGSFAVRLFKY
ncbi:MAG: 16S rRNA (cytosine(967)-C(5))-methyltransferase RsmB [Candidatus Marinimicrobia bacterium]|nr:16S rRNA (cytosine(967)-C(5))-methyltransferase RsmB [Candidatus Neomarinimicrobiota bacterium]